MSVVAELSERPGVIAAGEYSYRGDRFSCEGNLSDEHARMASIMCRATSLGTHMEADILGSFCPQCGVNPMRGWVVRGPDFTVCVMANVFCFLDNRSESINEVLGLMKERLTDAPSSMI